VACANGHSFDVARQGYVSLLTGDPGPGSGDTAAMVAARKGFLEAGHLEPLSEALREEAGRALGDAAGALRDPAGALSEPATAPAPGCLLDLGAGTGHHLARLLDRFPGRTGLALDLSKHALRRAARAHPRIAAVACDAWGPLPVRDGVAALVLGVFAPRNGPEIARVLRPGGALLIVTPTERHLAELVSAFGLLSVDARKDERLAAQLGAHLDLERRVERGWRLDLTATDVANAVAMGPSARHVPAGLEVRPMRATASVTISTYRRGPG
jgi:23S rRNA (guanine745-N1)-methyltransferase